MEPTPPPRLWCRLTVVGPDGQPAGCEVLQGGGRPDLGVVDTVARRSLDAARGGGRLVLREVDPELMDLLRLAGLVVGVRSLVVEAGADRPSVEALSVDVEREAEGGEQPLGVEEI